MDSVLRAAAIYFILLLLFRLTGNRVMGQMTAFDFILLLIVSETVQQAMITEDYSITNAFILVMTLLGIDIVLSFWKNRSPGVEKFLDGIPLVVIKDGRLQRHIMKKERIDEGDILAAARSKMGLERIDQIKHAVLEANGEITVIPNQR
ncbi:MAG: YetF domain-containing protein [Gemmatimonadaceae bacterium]